MDRLARECRYPLYDSRGDEGESTFYITTLVGFVCAVQKKKRIKAGSMLNSFRVPKLFVGGVVGDCVQILGGAWAIRLDQLSLGFG